MVGTGTQAPGSTPLGNIDLTLANPRVARYQVAQRREALGLSNPSASKGGSGFIKALSDFQAGLETPKFYLESSVSGPYYIMLQTEFMFNMLVDSIKAWSQDLPPQGAIQTTSYLTGRHAMVTDGDHSFFRDGVLNVTSVYNTTMNQWVPVLYTWAQKLDTEHHRPHFRKLHSMIMEYCKENRIAFRKEFLTQILDFSAAQMSALAIEYAQILLDTMPEYSGLTGNALKTAREALIKEAEQIKSGCESHFLRSAVQLASNGEIIPLIDRDDFMRMIYTLISRHTTIELYHEIMAELRARFPKIKWWLNWWQRPPIATMIFPACSVMDPGIALNIPRTTNPVEHQHSLLHHATGTQHDLLTGIKKIYGHVRELELQYNAIIAGHYIPPPPRDRAAPKVTKPWEPNDGRAPDTKAALDALDKSAASDSTAKAAVLSKSLRRPSAPQSTSPLFLQSYTWNPKNSCFIDNGIEIWFRAYSLWSPASQKAFLATLPQNSYLATMFYHFDFWYKALFGSSSRVADSTYASRLELIQAQTFNKIWTIWKVHKEAEFGCPMTWMSQAICDGGISDEILSTFCVGHSITYECAHKHLEVVPDIAKPVLWFRLFTADYEALQKSGSTEIVSLNDLLSHHIPRRAGGNFAGGATPLHFEPLETCPHSSCASDSVRITCITTHWPQILCISSMKPLCPHDGSEPNKPNLVYPLTMSIPDINGTPVTYELVGRQLFVNNNHFVSQIRLGDHAFAYDDMKGGLLQDLGHCNLLETINHGQVCYVYHRTSDTYMTTRQIDDIRHDWSQSLANYKPQEFPISLKSQSPSPEIEEMAHFLCSKCAVTSPLSGSIAKCTACSEVFHEDCVRDQLPDAYVGEFDTWWCEKCFALEGDKWVGEFVLFPVSPRLRRYPAKILCREGLHDVRLQWYEGNVYLNNDIAPKQSEFTSDLYTCIRFNAYDSMLYNESDLGAIKWPLGLCPDANDTPTSEARYRNELIENSLAEAYPELLSILRRQHSHPVTTMLKLYVEKNRSRHKKMKAIERAQSVHDFIHQFNLPLIPGDVFLVEEIIEARNDTLTAKDLQFDHSMSNIIAKIILSVVVIRCYLARKPQDDEEIFYLCLKPNYHATTDDLERFSIAKHSTIVRDFYPQEKIMNLVPHGEHYKNFGLQKCLDFDSTLTPPALHIITQSHTPYKFTSEHSAVSKLKLKVKLQNGASIFRGPLDKHFSVKPPSLEKQTGTAKGRGKRTQVSNITPRRSKRIRKDEEDFQELV